MNNSCENTSGNHFRIAKILTLQYHIKETQRKSLPANKPIMKLNALFFVANITLSMIISASDKTLDWLQHAGNIQAFFAVLYILRKAYRQKNQENFTSLKRLNQMRQRELITETMRLNNRLKKEGTRQKNHIRNHGIFLITSLTLAIILKSLGDGYYQAAIKIKQKTDPLNKIFELIRDNKNRLTYISENLKDINLTQSLTKNFTRMKPEIDNYLEEFEAGKKNAVPPDLMQFIRALYPLANHILNLKNPVDHILKAAEGIKNSSIDFAEFTAKSMAKSDAKLAMHALTRHGIIALLPLIRYVFWVEVVFIGWTICSSIKNSVDKKTYEKRHKTYAKQLVDLMAIATPSKKPNYQTQGDGKSRAKTYTFELQEYYDTCHEKKENKARLTKEDIVLFIEKMIFPALHKTNETLTINFSEFCQRGNKTSQEKTKQALKKLIAIQFYKENQLKALNQLTKPLGKRWFPHIEYNSEGPELYFRLNIARTRIDVTEILLKKLKPIFKISSRGRYLTLKITENIINETKIIQVEKDITSAIQSLPAENKTPRLTPTPRRNRPRRNRLMRLILPAQPIETKEMGPSITYENEEYKLNNPSDDYKLFSFRHPHNNPPHCFAFFSPSVIEWLIKQDLLEIFEKSVNGRKVEAQKNCLQSCAKENIPGLSKTILFKAKPTSQPEIDAKTRAKIRIGFESTGKPGFFVGTTIIEKLNKTGNKTKAYTP